MKSIAILFSASFLVAACGKGEQGPPGPQGPEGAAGRTGAEGPVGDPGPRGAEGEQGPAGLAGPIGVEGPVGDVGPVGPQGPDGLRGPTGPIGPVGPQGIAGPQGAAGPEGPLGPAGAAGPQGPAGPSTDGDSGCPVARYKGACVVGWGSQEDGGGTDFLQAASVCAQRGGDLCTDSQAWTFTHGQFQDEAWATLLWGQAWTASFADNDGNQWEAVNGNTEDDHPAFVNYGYSCCGGTTPINPRLTPTVVNGVRVLAVHDRADTYWSGAATYCTALGGDICSDSQTALIRAAGALTQPSWTSSHADNDSNLYGQINGDTNDDTGPWERYAFACCASNLAQDLACPVQRVSGVCAPVVHDSADTDFMTAAQACANAGADLCSTSQLALLRVGGTISGPVWSNSHSDNDGDNLSFAVGNGVDDDPDLGNSYGYACCIK